MCRDEKEEVRRTWSNVCEAKNTETLRKIVQEYKEKEQALAIAQNAKNKKRAFSKIKSLLHSMTKAFSVTNRKQMRLSTSTRPWDP